MANSDNNLKIPPALNAKIDALTGEDKKTAGWEHKAAAVNWKIDLEVRRAMCKGNTEASHNPNAFVIHVLEAIVADPKGISQIVATFSDPAKKKMEEALVGTEFGRAFACSNHPNQPDNHNVAQAPVSAASAVKR